MTLNAGHTHRTRIQRGGTSVLAFLSAVYTHSDAATWAARLAAGEVDVDGVRARGDEVLRAGQVLAWHRPPWVEAAVPLHYDVLYRAGGLLAVHKPAGLPTVPGGGFSEHTLLAAVRRAYPGASPLHRLGRGTSGVVLFALDALGGAELSRAWREHAVRKVYRALVAGVVGPGEVTVTAPIGPVAHPRLGTVHAASPDGRPSHSTLRVVERRRADGAGPGSTLVDVDIRTGRPHQIRIHAAAAGHPLVGDALYAPGGGVLARPGLPGDVGYWLHAWQLTFTPPGADHAVTVHAPLPEPLRRGAP